jgi:hypothetical protein
MIDLTRRMTQSTDNPLAEALQAFLRAHIESHEQLDVLILLSSQPDRVWAPKAIATELRITEALAEAASRFLCRQSLLTVQIGARALLFVYKPRSRDLDELVKALTKAYREQRLEVIRLMTANALERLRLKSIRSFSDAFILAAKKNKDG